MKYVVLVTAGLIVLFFGAYFGMKWLNNNGAGNVDTVSEGGSESLTGTGEQVFTSEDGSVSVTYPVAQVIPQGVPSGPTEEWRVGATKANGMLLASIIIPKKLGTNFSEAHFTIGRSADPDEIKNCSVVQDNFVDIESVTVGGYPFKKFEISEAAAGNRYDSVVRRGIFDGDCYTVEYTIHSTNIDNYPKEDGIQEFDRDEVVDILEDMAKSVKWNISSD